MNEFELVETVTRAVAEATKEVLDRFKAKIDALEARVAELEGERLRYRGMHSRFVSYAKGDFVTFNGSLWIACAATQNTSPGNGPDSGWLMVTKGPAPAPLQGAKSAAIKVVAGGER